MEETCDLGSKFYYFVLNTDQKIGFQKSFGRKAVQIGKMGKGTQVRYIFNLPLR
jgi:hypothetical protein